MNIKQTKINDIVEFVYRAKVTHVGRDEITVEDRERGEHQFKVVGASLVETGISADRFSKEETINKTKAVEILEDSRHVMTVNFDKANGQNRTLRGYLVTKETGQGRSVFADLDIAEGHNLRQVDHRTLKWVIYNDVKYTVK